MIVKAIAVWTAPFGGSPDLNTARRTVGEAISHYGAEAVREGFVDYKAQMDDGKVRVPSLKGLYGFIRQAKHNPTRSARGQPPRQSRPHRPTRSEIAEAVAEIEAGEAIDATFTRVV